MKKTIIYASVVLCFLPSVVNAHDATGKTVVSAQETFFIILIALLLGIVGQGIRALLSWIKLRDRNAANALAAGDGGNFIPETFSGKRFAINLGIAVIAGALAGILAMINMDHPDPGKKEVLIAFIGAGYAGTDFIESIMAKWLPK